MDAAAGVLIVAVLGCIYVAAVLATVDGVVRAIRERYLPPWVVGLATALLLGALYAALDSPFGRGGGLFAVPCGIVAGAVYGLRRRARLAFTVASLARTPR